MANHVSALKRARQTEFRTDRNRANASRLRTALRDVRAALATGDQKQAQAALQGTISAIDKAVQKGTLHKNTASRYKSRLSTRVNKLGK
jgi:small subunit ribosomal protein S20